MLLLFDGDGVGRGSWLGLVLLFVAIVLTISLKVVVWVGVAGVVAGLAPRTDPRDPTRQIQLGLQVRKKKIYVVVCK